MTILVDIIPAKARKYVYAAWALVGLVLGSAQIAGSDVATANAVYLFASTALGLTASANTSGKKATPTE